MSMHNTLAEDILKEHPDMKLSELSFPRITDRDFWKRGITEGISGYNDIRFPQIFKGR